MQWAVDELGGSASIGRLQGIEGHSATVTRGVGVVGVVGNNPGISILVSDYGDFNQTTAETVVTGWFDTYGTDIDAIVAHNDTMILGAIDAAASSSITGVLMVGFDGIPDTLTAIGSGTLGAAMLQDTVLRGSTAVGILGDITVGDTVDHLAYVQLVLITADNVADYQ